MIIQIRTIWKVQTVFRNTERRVSFAIQFIQAMMFNQFNKKNNILLGVPILLLLSSLAFAWISKTDSLNQSNPYLPSLPSNYIKNLQKSSEADTSFYSFLIEEYAKRELIIIKDSLPEEERKFDFRLEVYPKDKSTLKADENYHLYKIRYDAVAYKYKNKKYGVFRHALPFIDIEKIVVKQITKKSPGAKSWQQTISTPLKSVAVDFGNDNRDYSGERVTPNIYQPLFTDILSNNNIRFLPYTYKREGDSILQISQNLNEYLLEQGQTLGVVNNTASFWESLTNRDKKSQTLIKFKGENKSLAIQLLTEYLDNELEFIDIFNTKKLAMFYALKNLFSINCEERIGLLYNSEDQKLEPFFVHSKCLGSQNDYVKKLDINDLQFITLYAETLNDIVNLNIYQELIMPNKRLESQIHLINKFYPEKLFDFDLLNINQRVIRKNLNPSTALVVQVVNMTKKRLELSVYNISNYPIEITGLNYQTKKDIVSFSPSKRINSGKKETITITLPRSFENLFVKKKKKQTKFVYAKHIFDLFLSYSISGLVATHNTELIAYPPIEETREDLFRKKTKINKYSYLDVDELKKTITVNKNTVVISSPLIVPKGYTLHIKEGTLLDIVDGGKIITNSPIIFIGSKLAPITIESSDNKGQGILVIADGKKSNLEFVNFKNLTNPKHGDWSTTGAITFYESPVNLFHVTITGNRCEDALNIVRTKFLLNWCTISNTQSDAFDGDFANGKIINSTFSNLGNDAIDVSGSDILISKVTIINPGDKGLSAGENSKMTVSEIEIRGGEIAIAGKDLSVVKIDNIKIADCKLGFTAFQKKPEFGPSEIIVKNVVMENVQLHHLVESTSLLVIDGEKMKAEDDVKSRMYGVEFGVSSEKTKQ